VSGSGDCNAKGCRRLAWGLSYGSLSHVLYEQQAFSRKESDIGHRKIQQWGPWQKEQIIE
jgi:hypothetical protein